jgi:undecaprenyl-diphosphatase
LRLLIIRIQRIDEAILHYFNRQKNRQNIRTVMKLLSHPPYWRAIVIIMVSLLLLFGSTQSRWRVGYFLFMILFSDQTCNIIKAIVKRVRPDGLRNTEGSIWRKLGYYSFPSSHAANTFAAAMLLSVWWPFMTIPLYFSALLISFSRIYLNNHYPSDVFAGGLIGLTYGLLVRKVFF